MLGKKKSVNREGDTAELIDEDPVHHNEVETQDRRKRQNMLIMVLTTSFAVCGQGLFMTVYSQWIYVRFEKEVLGANFSKLNESAAKDPCFRHGNNTHSPYKAELLQAQSDSARFGVYVMLCSLVPSFFVNMVLGAYSDQIGRRIIFIIPIAGSVIRTAITCAVAHWELDLHFILVGSVINGLSGDFVAFIMAVFVYTADNTSRGKNRSFLMVFSQGLISICYNMTGLASGFFIESMGYVWPMVTALIAIFFGWILCIFFIRETLDKSRVERKSLFPAIRGIFSFYWETPENPLYKRSDFILLGLIFFVYSISLGSSITTLYLMNEPFCWESTHLGYVTSAFGLAHAVLATVMMRLLQMVMSDELVCVLSLLASVANRLLFAFANYDWQIYVAYTAGAIESPVLPIIRAILSRMVHPNKRGSIFASVAVMESATIAASGTGLNELYASTVGQWRGLTYFVIGCIVAASAVLFLIYTIMISHRHTPGTTLTVEDPTADVTGEGSDAAARIIDNGPQKVYGVINASASDLDSSD